MVLKDKFLYVIWNITNAPGKTLMVRLKWFWKKENSMLSL